MFINLLQSVLYDNFLIVLDKHSVFKASEREEVRGAEEVAEDENTAVELPIDQVHLSPSFVPSYLVFSKNVKFQREADIVEDEELPERDQFDPASTNHVSV